MEKRTKTGYVPILVPEIPEDVPWDKGVFDPWDLWCPRLWTKFMEAINERRLAANLPTYSTDSSGQSPYDLYRLQLYVFELLVYFANKWNTVGIKEFNHIRLINLDYPYSSAQEYLPLPPFTPPLPDNPYAPKSLEELITPEPYYCIQTCRDVWWEILKFRRAYPLNIYKLDDYAQGKSGRARFEATNLTPDDQKIHSGKYFEGGNGVWTLSDDQDSQPTTLYDVGFAQRKDYIGSWILEDVRTAIRKLRYTYSIGRRDFFGPNDPIYFASTFQLDWIAANQGSSFCINDMIIGINGSQIINVNGVQAMSAYCISNWKVANPNPNEPVIGFPPSAQNYFTDLPGGQLSECSMSANNAKMRFTFESNLNKKVDLYCCGGYAPNVIDSEDGIYLHAHPMFQNFGQPFKLNIFTLPDTVESNKLVFFSKELGNANAPPQPWGPIAQASINRSDGDFATSSAELTAFGWGYEVQSVFAICDWYRAGGFKYK